MAGCISNIAVLAPTTRTHIRRSTHELAVRPRQLLARRPVLTATGRPARGTTVCALNPESRLEELARLKVTEKGDKGTVKRIVRSTDAPVVPDPPPDSWPEPAVIPQKAMPFAAEQQLLSTYYVSWGLIINRSPKDVTLRLQPAMYWVQTEGGWTAGGGIQAGPMGGGVQLNGGTTWKLTAVQAQANISYLGAGYQRWIPLGPGGAVAVSAVSSDDPNEVWCVHEPLQAPSAIEINKPVYDVEVIKQLIEVSA